MSYAGISTRESVTIGGMTIPITVCRAIVMLPQFVMISGELKFAVQKYAISILAFLFPVYAMSIVIIKVSVYANLLIKSDKIDGIFDRLQAVVNKRTFVASSEKSVRKIFGINCNLSPIRL